MDKVLVLDFGGQYNQLIARRVRAEHVYAEIKPCGRITPEEIKANLIAQLTSPVRWIRTINNMIDNGATEFTECGPGNVLQGMIKKIQASRNA